MGPFLVELRSKASKWGCGTPESLKALACLFFCSRNSAHSQVAVSLLDLENGDSKDRKMVTYKLLMPLNLSHWLVVH